MFESIRSFFTSPPAAGSSGLGAGLSDLDDGPFSAFQNAWKSGAGLTDLFGPEPFKLHDAVGRSGAGNHRPDVAKVETLLGKAGYYKPMVGDAPNGWHNTALDGAIKSFQKDHGLQVDGVLKPGGPTITKIEGMMGGGTKAQSHLPPAIKTFDPAPARRPAPAPQHNWWEASNMADAVAGRSDHTGAVTHFKTRIADDPVAGHEELAALQAELTRRNGTDARAFQTAWQQGNKVQYAQADTGVMNDAEPATWIRPDANAIPALDQETGQVRPVDGMTGLPATGPVMVDGRSGEIILAPDGKPFHTDAGRTREILEMSEALAAQDRTRMSPEELAQWRHHMVNMRRFLSGSSGPGAGKHGGAMAPPYAPTSNIEHHTGHPATVSSERTNKPLSKLWDSLNDYLKDIRNAPPTTETPPLDPPSSSGPPPVPTMGKRPAFETLTVRMPASLLAGILSLNWIYETN